MSADRPTLNSAVLAQFSIFFQLTLQKHLCPPLFSLGLINVTRSSQAALNIFLKNYKRSRTQLQDSSSKLINEIMFHPFSELFTGCPSKHTSSVSCQHSVSPFFLIQPLFIRLPSPFLLPMKTILPLLWRKNFTHSTQKDQNIWTSLIFPCHSFCLEFSALWN